MGLRGLVLIEAKAHAGEINDVGGKHLRADPSADGVANQSRIAAATTEARDARLGPEAGVSIGRDRCHRFSHRVAFTWKLAAEEVPVALVYRAFAGDDVHSDELVAAHTGEVVPAVLGMQSS